MQYIYDGSRLEEHNDRGGRTGRYIEPFGNSWILVEDRDGTVVQTTGLLDFLIHPDAYGVADAVAGKAPEGAAPEGVAPPPAE